MQPFLVFGLSASIGAMGEIAGNKRRGTLTWPLRSALIGLMGAAMGIERNGDFSVLDRLVVDVAIFHLGNSLQDYHTVETIPEIGAGKNSMFETSRSNQLQMVAAKDKNTFLTSRDYVTDVFYGISVSGSGIEEVSSALRRPSFPLCLGRKSCSLSAPTGARIVNAETSEMALAHIQAPPWLGMSLRSNIMVSDCDEMTPGREIVHDRIIDRTHRHFGIRYVVLKPVDIVLGGVS